jgi:signal peptidase I
MATEAKKGNSVVETIKTVVWALVIAGVFRTLFFQPFWIPSGSMKSTLLIGDLLCVNKMAYGYSAASCPNIRSLGLDAKTICGVLDNENTRVWGAEPERGDVIVFRHPVSGLDYIKRVIGMPGDTVQVQNGIVYLNGQALPQEQTEDFVEVAELQGPQRLGPRCSRPVGAGGDCHKGAAIETLPDGRSYTVLNIGNRGTDNTTVFTVPAGHYFFMGDNRDNSTDSRVPKLAGGVGMVPYENLIGRADRIMFSSGGTSMFAFWTWRGDRFFKAVE